MAPPFESHCKTFLKLNSFCLIHTLQVLLDSSSSIVCARCPTKLSMHVTLLACLASRCSIFVRSSIVAPVPCAAQAHDCVRHSPGASKRPSCSTRIELLNICELLKNRPAVVLTIMELVLANVLALLILALELGPASLNHGHKPQPAPIPRMPLHGGCRCACHPGGC